MEEDISKFVNRDKGKPGIGVDFIKGRKLTSIESLALMYQDTIIDEKEFEEIVKKYVKVK